MVEIFVPASVRPGDELSTMTEIVRVAVEVAVGLRRSLTKNGVRQIADFVNGMALAGLLLQKNYRPKDEARSFSDTFSEKLADFALIVSAPQYEEHRKAMIEHRIGVADMSPNDMLVTAGLAAQETVTEIAEEQDFSRQAVMDLVTFVIALALVASTPKDRLAFVLEGMVTKVVENTKGWDEIIPSDDELFGDE